MREIALAAFILGSLVGLAFLSSIPWEPALAVSWWITGIGMALGVPTGVLYHVQLYRKLTARNVLPDDWIWRPIRCNALLTDVERVSVMPWFIAGGLGFVIVVLGIIAIAVSLASAWLYVTS